MSYEKVVLTDGTEVLFITSEDPQAPDTTDADTHLSDTTRLSAAIASESRVSHQSRRGCGKLPRSWGSRFRVPCQYNTQRRVLSCHDAFSCFSFCPWCVYAESLRLLPVAPQRPPYPYAFERGCSWIPGSWMCRWRTTRLLSCFLSCSPYCSLALKMRHNSRTMLEHTTLESKNSVGHICQNAKASRPRRTRRSAAHASQKLCPSGNNCPGFTCSLAKTLSGG